MKHDATGKSKFRKLVRRLRPLLGNMPVSCECVAVGLLEQLWHTTMRDTPEGDIGRLDNEMIAELVGWFGDPEVLVEILVDCGWLDSCEPHRLVVHDWQDHAPKFIAGNLKSRGKHFAIAGCLERGAIAGCLEQAALSEQQPNITKHNITKHNQTKPNKPASAGMSPDGDVPTPEAFVEAWNQTPGVVPIRNMSNGRRRKLQCRLREDGWWNDFQAALEWFPLAFKGRDGNWRPGFDFIVKPESVINILEGKYGGKQEGQQDELDDLMLDED